MDEIFEETMRTQRNVASFLLRFTQDLWQDENGEPRVQWRGHIDHVQGKESIPFIDFTEAISFMQKQLQDLTLQAFPTTDPQVQDKLLKESFKLWDDFARSYTELILQTLGRTVDRSQELQEQFSEAITKTFRMWIPPAFRGAPPQAGESQKEDVSELVRDLSRQIEELNNKIKALETPEE